VLSNDRRNGARALQFSPFLFLFPKPEERNFREIPLEGKLLKNAGVKPAPEAGENTLKNPF